MSYMPVGPVNGLGYTFTIKTPVGDQKISVPLETMANDVANMAVNAVWPVMLTKLQGELPNLMDMTYNAAKPYLEAEKKKIIADANKLMKSAETKVETQVSKTTNVAALLIGLLVVGGAGVVLFSKIKSGKKAKLAGTV